MMKYLMADPSSNGDQHFQAVQTAETVASGVQRWEYERGPRVAGTGIGIVEPVCALVVASLADGRLHVWAVTTQHTLWTCWHTQTAAGAPWSAWEPFSPCPGPVQQVTLGRFPDGRVSLWVADPAGQVLSCWQTETSPDAPWSAWHRMAPIVELIPQPDPGGAYSQG